MQTQYRLLYRYVNPTTSTPITNEAEYIRTEDFYTKKHKIQIDTSYITNIKNTIVARYGEISNFPSSDYNVFKYEYEGIQTQDFMDTAHNEADSERETMITENMSNAEKSNNLFIYKGTRKSFHKQYIPDQLGYVVRDWTKVPSDQIPDGPDDYTKHFVMLGGIQLGFDGAYLVCKPQYIGTYMTKINSSTNKKCFVCFHTNDLKNIGYKLNSNFYQSQSAYIDNIDEIIDEHTFFKWYNAMDSSIESKYGETPLTGTEETTNGTNSNPISGKSTINPSVRTPVQAGANNTNLSPVLACQNTFTVRTSNGTTNYKHRNYYIFFHNTQGLKTSPIQNGLQMNVGGQDTPSTYSSSTYYQCSYTGYDYIKLVEKGYTNYGQYIEVSAKNIIRDVIPAHYEETGKSPYYIKDMYEKIKLSPWITHSIHNSLDSALTSAKTLVSMIGIDNVKLVKYVPFDQFIKIK